MAGEKGHEVGNGDAVRRRERGRPAFEVGTWEYRDDGCEYAPSCLSCPFPICKHNAPAGVGFPRWLRNNDIAEMRQRGALVEQIAAAKNISLRSVYRIIAAQKTLTS